MDLSIFLAKVMGLYLVIGGVATLINYKTFRDAVKDFAKSRIIPLLSGVLALMIGLLLVVSHNVWEGGWPVIITVIGWLAVLEGILYLVFPGALKWIAKKITSTWYVVFGVVYILLGAYLCYVSFWV